MGILADDIQITGLKHPLSDSEVDFSMYMDSKGDVINNILTTYNYNISTDRAKINEVFFNMNRHHQFCPNPNYKFYFADGKKDNWCCHLVYCHNPLRDVNGNYIIDADGCYTFPAESCSYYRLSDKYYFEQLLMLSLVTGCPKIKLYNIVHEIYVQHKLSGYQYNLSIIKDIQYKSLLFGNYWNVALFTLTAIYYGMVAEEYYVSSSGKPTQLGASVKMLGVYEVLIEGKPVQEAATCNNGVNFESISEKCDSIGIIYK